MPTISDRSIDKHGGLSPRYIRWRMVAKTASYTVTEDDWGTLFTNQGAGGAVTFTLPTARPDLNGCWVRFYVVADQNLIVNCATNDTIIAHNDVAADSVAYQTAGQRVGGCFDFMCNGTVWCCMPHQWDNGVNAQTLTITT